MGSVLIGSLASVMGIAGSLTACASVCALAAGALLLTTIRQPAKVVQAQRPVEDIESEVL
jgi:hypothetical protein